MNLTTDELHIRIRGALVLAMEGNNTDGAHHKQWFFDQIARCLCGGDLDCPFGEFTITPEYEEFLKDIAEGGFSWDTGRAP